MKIFIGYDSREDVAYQVCKESLARELIHLARHSANQAAGDA
jgi:hypothetical protein